MSEQQPQPPAGPPGEGEGHVLAYFELLRAWQMPITVETENGVEAEGIIEALDPQRHRVTLSILNAPTAGLDPDDPVKLYFGMEDGRWMGSAMVQLYRDNRRSFVLTLPRRLEPRDRRKSQRVRGLEGITALIRLSEFSGSAFHGAVTDLSEGGLQLRVERSTEPLAEDAQDPEAELGEGLDLTVVRVSGLGGREIEAAGRLIHLNRDKQGLLVGLRFRNLKGDGRTLLETYLAPKVREPLVALPPLAYTPGVGFSDSEATVRSEIPPEQRTDALLRLKKRGRTLLVAMPPGVERDEVLAFISADGYGRAVAAGTLSELMEALQALPVHGVFIDGGVAEMGGVELASFIHYAKGDQPCPIFLVEYKNGGNLEAAAKLAGVDRILPRPYLVPGLLGMLEVELELRPREEAVELPALASDGRGRLLRRFRGIALVMPPGAEREALLAFLGREGFTRVMPAGTIAELVRTLESSALAVAFIDWPESDLMGLEIAHFLDSVRFEGQVRLVLAAAKPSPRLINDARALGVAQVLLKPYNLDGALAELFTSCLGE